MKDLYKRIGLLSSDASSQTIEQALLTGSVSRSDSSAAAFILLDSKRRQVYDRTHATLLQIGQLRANMGLNRTPIWVGSGCHDFDSAPTGAGDPTTRPKKKVAGESRARWIVKLTLMIVLIPSATAAICAGLLFTFNPTSTTPPNSQPTNHKPFVARTAPTVKPPKKRVESPFLKSIKSRLLARARELGTPIDENRIEDAIDRRLAEPPGLAPFTGLLQKSFESEAVAPLRINTARASGNYYVKIIDWYTKKTIAAAYIVGGEFFETKVPLGSYELRYATGNQWRDEVLLFGEETQFSRADDRFDFTSDAHGYSGYTVTLILQRDGNLKTEEIPPDDF